MLKYIEDVHEIKNDLICSFKNETSKGLSHVSTEEASKITDMIKDLAEAEEKAWKACYYQLICQAMMEAEHDSERMGYDHWRYSSGRFAPKGHGHMSGYNFPPMPGHHMDPAMIHRMGYGSSGEGETMHDYGRGHNYEGYARARRHFTETKDPHARAEMNERAREYTNDAITSIGEMMMDADPELKKKIKTDLANLLSQMP